MSLTAYGYDALFEIGFHGQKHSGDLVAVQRHEIVAIQTYQDFKSEFHCGHGSSPLVCGFACVVFAQPPDEPVVRIFAWRIFRRWWLFFGYGALPVLLLNRPTLLLAVHFLISSSAINISRSGLYLPTKCHPGQLT